MQSTLIICRVCICEFAYSLTLFITPKSVLTVLPRPFVDPYKAAKNLSHSMHSFPTQVREGDTLLLLWLSSSVCVLFMVHLALRFSHFLASGCWFCYLKWPQSLVLKWRLVPSLKKAGRHSVEKSKGMSGTAVGCESNTNEPTRHIKQGVFKQTRA